MGSMGLCVEIRHYVMNLLVMWDDLYDFWWWLCQVGTLHCLLLPNCYCQFESGHFSYWWDVCKAVDLKSCHGLPNEGYLPCRTCLNDLVLWNLLKKGRWDEGDEVFPLVLLRRLKRQSWQPVARFAQNYCEECHSNQVGCCYKTKCYAE